MLVHSKFYASLADSVTWKCHTLWVYMSSLLKGWSKEYLRMQQRYDSLEAHVTIPIVSGKYDTGYILIIDV